MRIINLAGEAINVIAVTPSNMAYQKSSIIWDGKTSNNETVAMSQYFAKINGGPEFGISLHYALPPLDPIIDSVALRGDVLSWKLRNTFAYVRCFLYDSSDVLLARPIWDQLFSANDVFSLDVSFLPFDKLVTARFIAWRADGGKSQTVNYSFTRPCTSCGDANNSGTINISDATFLITYIFSSGTPPGDCRYLRGLGDANGDGTVNMSDCVFLIAYIFAGGTHPHCQGM